MRRPRSGERGSESVELAILLPVAVLVIALVVVGARIAMAGNRITGVAGSAAREASLARSPGAAESAAVTAANQALRDQHLRCRDVVVNVDSTAFGAPPGSGAAVSVSVSCTVDLSDIGIAGLPGSRTITDTASSPVDPTREQP
ncbi:TadE/TadG family type IV pilus assembly protein [Klenkia sp. PcliD-1-E]|uniref:TadE/TadG family type IV pilus assembly protein n=1 Tax=Klenkia sp. PcliD-1-E TaxID=2954492 RepID=UPI002096BE35|nr:TadE/TadG family type IV pilus assembly protein [Klenkia sp. PcliD-1-E]MCO7218594.1 pilus assembly protein [Klenkia sp. PcliD-1-E]